MKFVQLWQKRCKGAKVIIASKSPGIWEFIAPVLRCCICLCVVISCCVNVMVFMNMFFNVCFLYSVFAGYVAMTIIP